MKHCIWLVPILAALPFACSESTSTRGQLITCTTDPDTGVVLRCEPGSGTGGAHECTDVDEDGDGQPTDTDGGGPVVTRTAPGDGSDDDADTDDDSDGIPDDDDCDEHQGEDDCDGSGEVDLPYDIRLEVGDITRPIADAFAEKGGQPAAIVSVTLDGGTWRLAELRAGTQFTVTEADCKHAGNRDVGRDRVVVTWRNANGTTNSDHLDLRYCGR